ncbi:MAG: hypothetical protein EXQ93_05015 [Alphaproteobacteria bacterium]|nr:hypothetical protein [Alphaproteobacteria bacterium]
MRQRNLIFGAAAAVVVVGAAGWFVLGGSGGATALPGDGGYQTQLSECQERVWGDQMHLAELEFTLNTVWHQDKPDVKLGGKFTMPGRAA